MNEYINFENKSDIRLYLVDMLVNSNEVIIGNLKIMIDRVNYKYLWIYNYNEEENLFNISKEDTGYFGRKERLSLTPDQLTDYLYSKMDNLRARKR